MKYNPNYNFHRAIVGDLRRKIPDEVNKRVSDANIYDAWRELTDMPEGMEMLLANAVVTGIEIDADATRTTVELLQKWVDAWSSNN